MLQSPKKLVNGNIQTVIVFTVYTISATSVSYQRSKSHNFIQAS